MNDSSSINDLVNEALQRWVALTGLVVDKLGNTKKIAKNCPWSGWDVSQHTEDLNRSRERRAAVEGDVMAYANPRWLEDGMEVFAPWELFCAPEQRQRARERGTAVRCRVAVAAGHAARIVNEARGIDRWLRIEDLRVPPGDAHL